MARNLLKAGFQVHAWNRTHDKAEALVPDGGVVHDNPAAAAKMGDVVITMVTDGSAVADLLFCQGVMDAMTPGSTVIDMSSIKPAEAKDHAARLSEKGILHLDAPVSGGTRGAAAANLAIMVGGDEAVFQSVKPVLAAMGRPVRVGPSGSGQLSKLANQAIVGITIGAVAEAMLLAEQGGADPAAIRDALKGGFADSIILQQHGERMTTGDFVPGGLSAIQLKDLNNALLEAERLGLSLPLAEQMRERFKRFCDTLDGGDMDHSGIYLELRDRNGI